MVRLAIKLTIISNPCSSTAKEVIQELACAANKIGFPVTANLRKRKIIVCPGDCVVTLLRNYNDSVEGEIVCALPAL